MAEAEVVAARLESMGGKNGGNALVHDDNPPSPSKIQSCVICLDTIQTGLRIKDCGHVFHTHCIRGSLSHGRKCPVCRKPVGGTPEGRCPSGTLRIHLTTNDCPGFTHCKAIQLDYSIPSGKQSSYHEKPGQPFTGDTRTAYLPNNEDRRRLLHRLKFSFVHGLTFTVGMSLTSGLKDVVTWTSIHHKTSLHGGQHGFPDDTYMTRCNQTLDALGVPPCDIAPSVKSETIQRVAPDMLGQNQCLEDHLEPYTADGSTLTENGIDDLVPLPPPIAPPAAVSSVVPPTALAPAVPAFSVPLTSSSPAKDPSLPPIHSADAPAEEEIEVSAIDIPTGSVDEGISPKSGDCSICLGALIGGRPCTRIIECRHQFHHDCLCDALNHGDVECPVCRLKLGPQGKSPSGTMEVKLLSKTECPGFGGAATIQLQYKLQAGQQQQYHANPGVSYEGIHRIAYLPCTKDGIALLQRLKYAFVHGLSFHVGKSMALGTDSAITWTTLFPHKTSLQGGAFGFPDDSYVSTCNQALDGLGVPGAGQC